jgi:beta-N-acetylhexosaminidase
VVQSRPADLTPADTSSRVPPSLAAALRKRHAAVDELLVPAAPTAADIAATRHRASGYDMVVVGTVAANIFAAQADLARAVLSTGKPTITIALRTPWDLGQYPEARTHVCSYGALSPTTEALAAALFGEIPFGGRLPVEMHGLYPRGHGVRT